MAHKEDVCLSHLLDTVCNDSVLQTLSEYHIFLDTFTQQCLSDLSVDVVLSGAGFDSLPPFYKLLEFGDGCLTASPRPCNQKVLMIYKNCLVHENPATDYSKDNKIPLYATTAKFYDDTFDSSKVILHVSSRTNSLVEREMFDTPFCSSMVVREDSQQVPKFHLSSLHFEEFVKKENSQLLLYQLTGVEVDTRKLQMNKEGLDSNRYEEAEHVTMYDPHLWQESQKHNIGALRILPAIVCSQWPKSALHWASRPRLWPNNSLVQEVLSCKILITSSPQSINSSDQVTDTEDISRGAHDLLWTFNFHFAEVLLLSQISSDTRRAFILLQALVNSTYYYEALKHVLFWCMEEHGPDLGGKGTSLVDKVTLLISKLDEYLTGDGVPHYFVSDTNILSVDDVNKEDISYMIGTEKSCLPDILLSASGLSVITSVKDLTFFSNTLFKNLKEKLYSTMEENARLLSIQLYQKLHSCDSALKSIEIHRNMIEALDSRPSCTYSVLYRTIHDFMWSSMGGVYFIQSLKAGSQEDRSILLSKSEEYLSTLHNTDMISNKLRQAVILLRKQHYQALIDLLEDTLDRLYADILAAELVCPEDRQPNYQTNVPFQFALENAAVHTIHNLDYLVMRMERHGLPREMSKNLSLAQFQLLGYTKYPVTVLNKTVLCAVFVSYAYSGLKKYSDARTVLEKVESISLQDEADMNEKRGCFNLNILSDAYLQAENIEQAKYLLHRSVTIMGNPRNPGRWALVSLNTRKMRDYVWGGMGIALATTVAAVTINFIFNRK